MIRSWSHPTTLAYAHAFLALAACLRRDVAATEHEAAEALELGRAYGLPSWSALAAALQGWALLQQGRILGGLDQVKAGTTAWNTRGFKHLTPILLTLQAESYLQLRQLRERERGPDHSRSHHERRHGPLLDARRSTGCKGSCCGAQGANEHEIRGQVSPRHRSRPRAAGQDAGTAGRWSASLASARARAGARQRENRCARSMAGSPKAVEHPIWKMRRSCSRTWSRPTDL